MIEHQYMEFFELSLDLLCIANQECRFVRVNRAWETILGWSKEDLLSMPYLDFVHPDDHEKTLAITKHLAQGNEAVNFENRYRNKAGEYRTLLWNATMSAKSDLTYALARDITVAKQESEALRNQQERTRLAQKASQIGFFEWDIKHGTLTWDEEMFRIYGFDMSKTDNIRDNWRQAIHPEDVERITGEFAEALVRDQRLETRFRIVARDGSIRYIKSIADIHRNQLGVAERMLGVNLEITDAERQREDHEKRLIVEAAPVALFMCSAKGQIVQANHRAAELFGYGSDALIGQMVEQLVPRHIADRHSSFRQDYQKNPEPRIMGAGRDLYGVRKDGSQVPVEIGLSSITTAGETVVIAAIVDITERKRFEADREKIVLELKRSNGELEQFAYIVSHDLRAPLLTIEGFAKKLAVSSSPRTEKEQHYLDRICANVVIMEELISDLLKFSRAARQEIQTSLVNFHDVITGATKLLADQIKDRDATVTVASDMPTIKCHPEKMVQVLTNLLSNSLKYSKKGVNPQIEITYEAPDEQRPLEACFKVKDNGIGIPDTQHHRIFKMFERIDPDSEIKGTGLGLAICKSIVEKHGGVISFSSRQGIGTEFKFTLPLKD